MKVLRQSYLLFNIIDSTKFHLSYSFDCSNIIVILAHNVSFWEHIQKLTIFLSFWIQIKVSHTHFETQIFTYQQTLIRSLLRLKGWSGNYLEVLEYLGGETICPQRTRPIDTMLQDTMQRCKRWLILSSQMTESISKIKVWQKIFPKHRHSIRFFLYNPTKMQKIRTIFTFLE